MNKILPIFFVFIMLAACEPSKPDELIDENTYEQMFMEFIIINQMDENLLQNRSRDELREKIFEHYGVSEEEFRLSHEYYEQNIEEQVERVKEMTSQLREERDSLLTIQNKYEKALEEDRLDSLVQEFSDKE